MKTALVAVLAVLGSFFLMHAAQASGTVTITEDTSQNVSCSPSCTVTVSNSGLPGGEDLSWTSITPSYTPSGSWLSYSPTQSPQNIVAGVSSTNVQVVLSLNNTSLPSGNYSVTLTFNGQSTTPNGKVTVPPDAITVNLTVAAAPPGNPGGGSDNNTAGSASIACGSVQLNWTAGQNADSYNIDRNGSVLATHVAGTSYTDSTAVTGTSYTYTIQSYSATRGTSSWVTFSPAPIQATPCGSVGTPVNPTSVNTTGNSAVACNTILLTWGAGTNANSYDIFRNGTQIASHFAGTSYTDSTATSGTSYAYTISSFSTVYGNSSTVPFVPSSIQSAACQVNLQLSDELINKVNWQPYPYTSACAGTQTGTASPINNGEIVDLLVDICNNGSLAAQNVVLTSSFDAAVSHTEFACCHTMYTTKTGDGNASTVTWNLGTIAPNAHATVYIYMYPYVITNQIQTLQRFINSSSITYTSANGNIAPAGCVGNYANAASACVVSTGYVPFNVQNGSNATQQEVQP